MAFTPNFGLIMSKMPTYAENRQLVRQAEQDAGNKFANLFGSIDAGIQANKQRDAQARNEKMKQEVGRDILDAWDLQQLDDIELEGMPQEEIDRYNRLSNIYSPDMTDAQKFRKGASLLMPYDEEGAQMLLKQADEREMREMDARAKAEAQGKKDTYTDLIRIEKAIDGRNSSIANLMQRRATINPNDVRSLANIDNQIDILTDEAKYLSGEKARLAEGTELADAFSYEGQLPKEPVQEIRAPQSEFSLEDLGSTSEVPAQRKKVKDALRDGLISEEEAKRLNEDISFKASELSRKAEPKRRAEEDKQKLFGSSEFIKQRQGINEWVRDREYLESMLDKDLNQAERGQLAFKIARVVTGPGVLTENDINSTKGQTAIDDALSKIGLSGFLKGSDYEQRKVKESIKSALGNTSVGKASIDNLNDLVNFRYNEFNPNYKIKEYTIGDFIKSKPVEQTKPSRKIRQVSDEELQELLKL